MAEYYYRKIDAKYLRPGDDFRAADGETWITVNDVQHGAQGGYRPNGAANPFTVYVWTGRNTRVYHADMTLWVDSKVNIRRPR